MAQETSMKIQVLAVTPDAERIAAVAAKQCYNAVDATDILNNIKAGEIKKLLSHCIGSGHLSILEHPSLTVAVSGCSRSFLAQITRHRQLSFSVQSQHYIDHSNFNYHIPSIIKDYVWRLEYNQFMKDVQSYYNNLVKAGVSPHDARQVLPNAVEARMVVSGNFRAWFEFLSKRICKRNTEEITAFSVELLKILQDIAPNIFNLCGANCQIGKCIEVSPCGKPYGRIAV